jgi:type I restriction enzyme M protein
VNKNLFDLNKEFSKSITEQFSKLGILDLNKSRGAFAVYWDTLSPDMKSVSASGWNAELIPEDDILKSQFADILEELKTNEVTRDEIETMLKEVNGEIKSANKEIGNLTKRIKLSANNKSLQTEKKSLENQVLELTGSKEEIEKKLATHTDYETKLLDAKKVIKEIKDHKDELVANAREKITPDEAKELILARWKEVLQTTIMAYVADYQRGFLNRLENVYEKYTVTINEILDEREKESAQLARFLRELEYE